MRDKEKSFISGVVYLHNDSDSAVKFFDAIDRVLNEHFETYELIVVNLLRKSKHGLKIMIVRSR